jgi:hypothetical protein
VDPDPIGAKFFQNDLPGDEGPGGIVDENSETVALNFAPFALFQKLGHLANLVFEL